MFGRRKTASPSNSPSAPLVAAPQRQVVIRKSGSEGQQAYEARRAAKAGLSVEKWREARAREREVAAAAAEAAKPAPQKPPGFFKRLLDRAHKPL